MEDSDVGGMEDSEVFGVCVSEADKLGTNEIRGTGNTSEIDSCDIVEVKNEVS
jgi:hypothetical protein